jgi:phosphate-selective porin OprO and OprP
MRRSQGARLRGRAAVLGTALALFGAGTVLAGDPALRVGFEVLEVSSPQPPAPPPAGADQVEQLRARVEALERQLRALPPAGTNPDRAAAGPAVRIGFEAEPDGKPEEPRKDQKPAEQPPKQEAEKGKTEKKGEDKEKEKEKPEPQWYEVGKDLKLSAAWDNGFVARTADEAFRFHLGGRLEYDNSWYTQDDNLLLGSSPSQRLNDGTLFRRARLRADGTLWEFIDFACEVNFANIQDVSNVQNQQVQVGSVGLTDFWVTFRDVPVAGNIRAGHFKAPVGLERDTSANVWYYMERSSLFDAFLGPNNYQNGVEVFDSYLDDRLTLAGAFTRIGKATVQSFGFGAGDGEYAGSVRLTGLPVYEQDGRVLVHLGVGYQHQALVGHQFVVASRPLIRSGSGTDGDTPNVLSTGTFFTPNGADIIDFEGAFVYGPFALSAEYALARGTDVFESFNGAVFSGPRGNVTYDAFYVEGGYLLTPGDYRRFDKKNGVWARTVPEENAFIARGEHGGWCCGRGAVQLVARYTFLNLVGGSPVLTPTSGGARAGRQEDVTLGVNWYLNPQVFIMVDYVWTHIDSVVAGASGGLQALGCRLHVDF